MDYRDFVYGAKLHASQIKAMTIKKFLYSIRNYILLIIQFVIPAFFIVLTMLGEDVLTGDRDLPQLSIAFDQYLQTLTTVEKGTFDEGSLIDGAFKNYQSIIENLPSEHTLTVADVDFEEQILNQYTKSVSRTNLYSMVGASFHKEVIKVWFNNQGYHTAPLTINLINNAILK